MCSTIVADLLNKSTALHKQALHIYELPMGLSLALEGRPPSVTHGTVHGLTTGLGYMKNINSLADVRQWHADQCKRLRRLANNTYSKSADLTVSAAENRRLVARAKAFDDRANMHTKAIQFINEFCL